MVKNLPVNTGVTGSIPGLGRSPGGNGNPLQYSCMETPTDRGAWWAMVHVGNDLASEHTGTQEVLF